MKIFLEKSSGRAKCRNENCKSNPTYISKNGRIIKGTSCVSIHMDSASGMNFSYYCRDCCEEIYLEMKKVLNPALWIFQ